MASMTFSSKRSKDDDDNDWGETGQGYLFLILDCGSEDREAHRALSEVPDGGVTDMGCPRSSRLGVF